MSELVYFLPGGTGSSPEKVARCVWRHLYGARGGLAADLLLLSDDPAAAAPFADVAIAPSEARDHVRDAVFYYPLNLVLGLGPYPRMMMRLRRLRARLACDFHGEVREDLWNHLRSREPGMFLFTVPSAMMAPWMVNWPELVVFHSRFLEGVYRARYDFRPRTAIVPNGIEADLLDSPPARVDLEGEPSVFFHGRLCHEKGVDLLVDAMAALPPETRARAHLHLAGDGPLARALARRARRAGLAARVHLLGHIPIGRAYSCIRSADVVVYPSRYDNFPVAVLEALAVADGPVVVSDHMGLVEHMGPALAANVVPPTAAAVRDAIVRVAEGRADARAAVEAQRALARELTWDRLARRYVEVFNAIH
jgi:glycogen(starch) synthase